MTYLQLIGVGLAAYLSLPWFWSFGIYPGGIEWNEVEKKALS